MLPNVRIVKASSLKSGARLSRGGPTRRDLLAAAPMGLAGLLTGLSGGQAIARTVDAITIAYPADLTSWDPTARITPLATAITESVFDAPLRLTPALKLIAGVASYRWLDKSALRLQLDFRDDVFFHTGEKLTARDFKFTYFDRLQQDPTLQLAAVWHSYIKTIETPSLQRAVLHFHAPMPWAPYLLAEMGEAILPASYFGRVGLKGFLAMPAGSGPYRLVEYQRDSRVVLEAFDRYWAGRAQTRRVTFQIMPDATARAAAMQALQADLTVNLSVRETQRLNDVAGLSGQIYPTSGVYMLHMVNKGPFKARNLRLAAHHAIDKQALSRAFFGGRAGPLSMLSPPGTVGHVANFRFAYDPAAARKLLAQSGYGPGKPVKVKFFTTNGAYASDFDMSRAIVQMWRKVGIEAELHVLSLPEYLLLSQSNKLEGPALWNWFTATGSPVIYGYILDPDKIFSAWKSDDVAARFAALRHETDYAKLTEAYKALEMWAVQEGYTVPLLQGTATVVHSKALKYAPFANGYNRPYYWNRD
jgi:peptide/nickel transport system substrate-binding protein